MNMINKKFYGNILELCEFSGNDKHAGSKARKDVYNILELYNFTKIYNYSQNNNITKEEKKNFAYYLKRAWNCLRSYISLRKYFNLNQYLLVQYPNYSPNILRSTIGRLFSGNKTIFLIHDVDSWRGILSKKEELAQLNSAEVLIVHNQCMENKLRQEGVFYPKIIRLEVFDYLVNGNLNIKKLKKSVVFAGNLEKSLFLKSFCALSVSYNIDLYGIGINEQIKSSPNVFYHGAFSPEELPHVISGGFGLVWDGESIFNCSGTAGEYMKWNNPHKLSLYIASGIPVIVWKDAAIAAFVTAHKIGYCIESLEEIDEIMKAITPCEYKKFLQNILPLQYKVTNGEFLQSAIEQMVEYIGKE